MKKCRVYRDTGWVGMLGGIGLTLNGNKVAKIYNKEWLEIPLVDNQATLQTSTFGQKSNKIEVNDSEDCILSTTIWGSYGIGLMLVLLVLSTLLRNSFLSATVLIFASVLLITAFIPGLHHKLEKLD